MHGHGFQLAVQRQAERLQKLLTLVDELTAASSTTCVAMVRVVKDVTMARMSMLIDQSGHTEINNLPGKGRHTL